MARKSGEAQRSQDALHKLQSLDFSCEAYRGYLIRTHALRSEMWIEKDGQLIHRVPATESWNYARRVIDQLVDSDIMSCSCQPAGYCRKHGGTI